MKPLLLTLLAVSTFACSQRQAETKAVADEKTRSDTLIKQDTVIVPNQERDWQEGFGLTHDPEKDSIWFKPVSYYISNKECSPLAIDFYYGRLRPGDDDLTDELLKLATTDNERLRPFYRWCLNKTIIVQDGALGEHTGIPARRYAEKFPKEFFEYMNIDTSGEKYNDWAGSIEYSGFYDIDDYRKPKEIQVRMANTMKANCKNCDDKTITRIEKFAKECFN
jgi:hypothetical protein